MSKETKFNLIVDELTDYFDKLPVGKENAVLNKELQEHLFGCGLKTAPATIRSALHVLRTSPSSPIIVAGKGYWKSQDPKEIADYVKSLNDRVETIVHLRGSIEAKV